MALGEGSEGGQRASLVTRWMDVAWMRGGEGRGGCGGREGRRGGVFSCEVRSNVEEVQGLHPPVLTNSTSPLLHRPS